MAKHAKLPPHEAAHDDSAKPPSADRRRWLKAGLSASPVLMTVASRPVLAGTCTAPSGHTSAGASGPGTLATCNGVTPNTWLESGDTKAKSGDTLARSSNWPTPFSPDSRFNDYFEPNLNSSKEPTFSDILDDRKIAQVPDTLHTVARYVTAALLNHAAGTVPNTVLSETAIRAIWSEYARTGSFAPTRGVSWSATEIVDYLKSTMTGG